MSYGYTCNWCKKSGKATGSQRDYPQLPVGWVKIRWDDHVCGECISKAKDNADK